MSTLKRVQSQRRVGRKVGRSEEWRRVEEEGRKGSEKGGEEVREPRISSLGAIYL